MHLVRTIIKPGATRGAQNIKGAFRCPLNRKRFWLPLVNKTSKLTAGTLVDSPVHENLELLGVPCLGADVSSAVHILHSGHVRGIREPFH